jgi:predicted transcriptional regulator YdeE
MLFFERDQELFISTVTSGFNNSNTVKLAALSGTTISYSLKDQSTYDYRVSAAPKRLDEKVPIGFSAPTLKFSTYTKYTTNSSVEKLLLYSLTGNLGTEAAGEYTTSFTSVNKLPEYLSIPFTSKMAFL